jgi:O-antigen ligase
MVMGAAPPDGVPPGVGGATRQLRASPGAAAPRKKSLARSAGEPSAGVLGTVAVAVALTPLTAPKGPGNGAPIDLLIALAVFAVFVWALRTRAPLRVPYVIPTTALILIGLASALLSAAPMSGGKAVVQEIFLYLWCIALATVCRTPRALGVVLRTWALSATAWAGVLVVAVVTGLQAVSGVPDSGTRAELFFDNPNMAGNFFMIAVFIVVAAGCPRPLLLRIGAVLLLVAAMFLTGSNAALLALLVGGVVALFLHVRARKGIVQATAISAMLVAGLGIAWVQGVSPLVAAAQQSNNPLLKYSIGRGARSAEARTSLFEAQLELYRDGHLLGIGPANTRPALADSDVAKDKSAHNDYLGTLVERGPLGALALAGLVGTVTARAVGVTRRPLPPRLAAAVPSPAALAGACAAFAFTALTHEVLHFRWLWAMFALLAALYVLTRESPPDARAGSAPPGAGLVPVEPRVR